jgi:hypothetical protein
MLEETDRMHSFHLHIWIMLPAGGTTNMQYRCFTRSLSILPHDTISDSQS